MKLNFLEKTLVFGGIFWGVLGMGLYFLGLGGLFYRDIVITYGGLCFGGLLYLLYRQKYYSEIKPFFLKIGQSIKKDWVVGLILAGFAIFAVLNFLIDLGPEVGFDALWYHLTLPKIYLMTHHISYLKGGLLYYSVMPRLAEMIYGFGLALNPGGMLPKIIHYLFGLFWFSGIYIFVRLFLSKKMALLAALAGYGTYLVTWLSQTAYIDLIVAYFSVMALWGVFQYLAKKKPLFLYLAAIFMGLTLSSKLYGLFLLAAILPILIFSPYAKAECLKVEDKKTNWRMWLKFAVISLLIVSPFYLQAYLATGNPFYPVFSIQDSALAMYTNGYSSLKDWYIHLWWKELPGLFWQMVIYRFTPFFGLIFLVFFAKKWQRMIWPLIIFLIFFVLWSLNPVQEPRYFIVILPIIALISFYVFENINWRVFKVIAVILLLMGLSYNFSLALGKFKETLEMVFGKNPRENYLHARLESPRNFYDFSGNFRREIKDKKVLTVNVHNLFYADFNFSDWSFVEDKYSLKNSPEESAQKLKKDGFDYVLIGDLKMIEWTSKPQEEIDKYFSSVIQENNFTLYRIERQK